LLKPADADVCIYTATASAFKRFYAEEKKRHLQIFQFFLSLKLLGHMRSIQPCALNTDLKAEFQLAFASRRMVAVYLTGCPEEFRKLVRPYVSYRTRHYD